VGPFCVESPILYDLCVDQKTSVYEVAMAGCVVQFKIRLPPVIRDQWYILAQKLNEVVLNEEQDKVIWKWSATRKFTIKSLYSHLTRNDNGPAYSNIWKSKLPEKIQIFMWLLAQGVVLTKGNMLSKNWNGNPGCYFCGALETSDRLLFQCPIVKVVWGIWAICFQQNDRPQSYAQFFHWMGRALPGGDNFFIFGLAAICW
jgi:hypothetical protein